jgi:hypothetical protein
MAIVTEEQVIHRQQTNCNKINTDSNYMHVNNIKMTNVKNFFVRFIDNKHRLLRLCIM